MALTDICLTERDSSAIQEQSRGDIGDLTDIVAGDLDQAIEEIPRSASGPIIGSSIIRPGRAS